MSTPRSPRRIALAKSVAASAFAVSCATGSSGFPEAEGWTRVGEVRVYNAENLWEYIDGAAVLFEEYGVRTCTTADMTAPGVSVTVDLYAMASPLGAVGAFKRENDGGEVTLAGATMAALSPPYQARLVKGNTYAKVNAYDGELTEPTARGLLEGIAAALSGETTLPGAFSLLPEAGRVSGSEGYSPGSLLSLAELADCVYADYEGSESDTWMGFAVLPSSADTVWATLASRWQSTEQGGHTILFREVPYSGLVGVARTEVGMFGVSGARDETQLKERLEAFATLR